MGVPAKYEGFSDDSKQHLDTPEEQVEAERKAPALGAKVVVPNTRQH